MAWFVDPAKANQLNLREAPKPAPIIVSLPAGTNVAKIRGHPAKPSWWEVEASVAGSKVRGFVHSGYLTEGELAPPPPPLKGNIPEAHLRRNGATRRVAGRRAFPLDETGMPSRHGRSASEIVTIIDYLAPDATGHARYIASGGKTFCNIYAYDFCQRANAYLPRVWWMNNALAAIRQGDVPPVLYGTTVRELNANMLHDWFIDYGSNFGWRRVFDPASLQEAANAGSVGIIVAKRVNLARSGHIVAVVPEHGEHEAARMDGSVTRPVQSQAGSRNFTAEVTSRRWWADATQFQSFGFWIHD